MKTSGRGIKRSLGPAGLIWLVIWLVVSVSAIAQDPGQQVLTTPGAWVGNFSTPHGCSWGVSAGAVDDQGRVYLRPSNASCGSAIGRLVVYDPGTQQFSAVGEFRHGDRDGRVETLQFFDGALYVGGFFTHVDGIPTNGLARLDLASGQWSAIDDGSGVSATGQISTVKVTATDIWVSGNFSQAGGEVANRIARFDRSSQQWEALGSGLDQIATALAIDSSGRLIAGGRFTTAGGDPAFSLAAWDGESWAAIEGIQQFGSVRALEVFDDRLFVGGAFRLVDTPGVNRSLAMWHEDEWSTPDPPLESVVNSPFGISAATVFSLTRVGELLYVAGAFERAGETELRNVAGWNPATNTWSSLGGAEANGLLTTNGFDAGGRALQVFGNQLYVFGQFTVAGGQAVNNLARFDLATQTWSPVGPATGQGINGQNVWRLSRDGNTIIASGAFYQSGLVRTQGIARWNPGTGNWSAFGGLGGPAIWRSVGPTATAGGGLYAGGAFSYLVDDLDNPSQWTEVFGLVRWDEDSQTWQTLNDSTSDLRTISAMAGAGDDLYIGGNFTEAGDQPASRIARWHTASQSWSPLGSGVDDRVRAIVVGPDGHVYVGGVFLNAGGIAAPGVARWSPADESWAGLGEGLSNSDGSAAEVYAIAVGVDGDVFVGGLFDRAGSVPVRNIARWDGSQWHALGDGIGNEGPAGLGIVYALVAAENGDVFAGGNFNRAGGRPANHLARWDGNEWSVLGTDAENNGVDADFFGVSGLVLIGADLYVGGGFSLAGGQPATHFAQFTRDLSGAEIEIDIEVEEFDGPSGRQHEMLAFRSLDSGLRYTVDVRNLGQNTARHVEFSVNAQPVPELVEWSCQALSGNAVCPAAGGTGLPDLVFNLPGLSSLRFELLVSVAEGSAVYQQTLDASSTLEPLFPGDIPGSQSSSNTLVNDRIFRARFSAP